MLRVLHVAETIKGGIGVHLEEVIPHQIVRFGVHAVRVILPSDERHFMPAIPDAVIESFARPGNRLGNTARLMRVVDRSKRGFRPDIIHVHSTFAGVAVRMPILLRGSRPAVVYCPHGWSFAADRLGLRRYAYAGVERVLARASDAIVNVSRREHDLAAAMGFDPAILHVVRNGVAEASYHAVLRAEEEARFFPTGRWNFVFIGRLDRQKGFDVLVDAACRVGEEAHFHVIGVAVRGDAGPIDDLPRNVTLHGWQPRERAAAFLAAADAVVMPSRWEGLPLVALEAMRAGKAVLASDRSAMPEVVKDGVTGRLVPIADGTGLAAAIGELTQDDLARWGSAAREWFERDFTIDRQCRELLDLYETVLAERRGRSA